jgi:glycosyltransferase involved in cell wall biosynthesis
VKLLVVTGIFPPDTGGPASFVPRLARALGARGWEVRIVTFSEVEADPADQVLDVTRIARGGGRLKRLLTLLSVLRRKGADADVWLIQGLPLAAGIMAALLRRPAVHKVVGDGAWETARNRGWFAGTLDAFQTARKGPRFAALRAWVATPLRWARAVVVPSRYLGGIVQGWGVPPGRIRLIYNAVEPAAVPPPRPREPRPFTLVTVCRLAPWKGVDGLLKALAELPDCRLVVVGDGPQEGALKREAARLQLAGRIEWTGALGNAEARAHIAAGDVFVLNSTYEGLPHVVLEAFEAGRPVIATAVGGTPELVRHGETGVLIEAGRPDQLAAAVRALRADPALAQRLTEGAARLRAETFGPTAMIESWDGLLRGVAAGAGR